MKLACVRCKHKKIKCDKAEPICHQCITSKSDCQYVERRKRPRLAQERVAVQHLSQRLESLEKRLIAGQQSLPVSPSQTPVDETASPAITVPTDASPNVALMEENGQESWIFRMATDAKREFLKANAQTPPHIDNAMSALNEALDDLGKLKVRVVEGQPSTDSLKISSAESRECVDAFVHLFNAVLMEGIFGTNGFPDVDTLYTFPDIVGSPYVTLDPGLHVLYYNALYHGLHQLHGPNDTRAKAAYLKVLDSVPRWLASEPGNDLDGWTAALTGWTAIINFDYQLYWKFHCKTCHFIKIKGIDCLDVLPAATHEEEKNRNGLRSLYWHALWCDMFFRLFYKKPSIIRYSPNRVKPPAVFTLDSTRPKASQVILLVVLIQSTAMSAEILNVIDSGSSQRGEGSLPDKIDRFCLEIEELIAEWNLENILHAESTTTITRDVIADCIMGTYSITIGIKRLVRRHEQEHPVDQITLRTARKIVRMVLDYDVPKLMNERYRSVSLQLVSFYPFCAVFSLYEYIIACTNPEECEDDLRALEKLGSVMTQTSAIRPDFATMARTINALNKVSRIYQDERRKKAPIVASDGVAQIQNLATPPYLERRQPEGFNLPPSTFDAFPGLVNPAPQFLASDFPEFSDFTGDGSFEPLEFVRALEDDFVGRNWHEDWWDIGGDMNSAG